MKSLTTLFCCISCFLFISSCSTKKNSTKHIHELPEIELINLFNDKSMKEFVLQDIEKEKKEQIAAEFTNPEHQINRIDEALNKGYYLLIEDICKDKFSGINEKNLEKYKASGWETRTIGFPNWITRLRGSLLLQEAVNLKYQILIMKLLDNDEFLPMIDKKENMLNKTLQKLEDYTNEENWTD